MLSDGEELVLCVVDRATTGDYRKGLNWVVTINGARDDLEEAKLQQKCMKIRRSSRPYCPN
jgi:hypothetical protein